MAKTIEEKRKKAREAQKAARDRAIARQLAKQKDPEFKEKQRKKALATAKRQQDRAIAKAKSPKNGKKHASGPAQRPPAAALSQFKAKSQLRLVEA
ncbi:hypothetical protein QNE90_000784 [Vibrio alginolyticus]|nr:hypothetical protein [Vibrio alginolyticus]